MTTTQQRLNFSIQMTMIYLVFLEHYEHESHGLDCLLPQRCHESNPNNHANVRLKDADTNPKTDFAQGRAEVGEDGTRPQTPS